MRRCKSEIVSGWGKEQNMGIACQDCDWQADNDTNREARQHAMKNPGHVVVKSTERAFYWQVPDGQAVD